MSRTTQSTQDLAEQQRILDSAVAVEGTQPDAALGILRQLAEVPDFPHSLFAREQAATIMWRMGKLEEAEEHFRKLIHSISRPEQSYARARYIVRYAEIVLGSGYKGSIDKKVIDMLEEAERIFQVNADPYMIGKVNQLKGIVSSSKGEWERAREQISRGQRMISTYATQGVTEASLFGMATAAPVGANN